MTREQALNYISFCIDDKYRVQSIDDMPGDARLVGWQCGFEPMFVAVWSAHLPGIPLEDDEAADIVSDVLIEREWFVRRRPTPPDFII